MSTKTLEQELAELTEATDYAIRMDGQSNLYVRIIYLPTRRVANGYVTDTGQIASRSFGGRRRFRKAGRWVRKTLRQHQAMMRDMGAVKIR